MKIQALLLGSILAFGPACSKSSPMDKMVSMLEDVGKAVEDSGGDCSKMADGVGAVIDKYDLKAMKEASEKLKGDKEQTKEMMAKYGDRMQKVMPQLMGMMKCANDPKMKELQTKLDGMM
jgi:hypothetical protein